MRQGQMPLTISAKIEILNIQSLEDFTVTFIVEVQTMVPKHGGHIEVIIEVDAQIQRVVYTVKHQQLLPRDNIPGRHEEHFTVALQWPDVFVYVSDRAIEPAKERGSVHMETVHERRFFSIPMDL